ncbi:MAG: DUF1015 domain-containing protein [Chlamydiota bacterium]|nr:DUF1015 domain-containing protein [Chlamydiota bacterium]
MAIIKGLKAVYFNQQKVSIDQVVTQPYDKIDEARYQEYLNRDPYNLVRIILPRAEQGHDYAAAKNFYQQCREKGVLNQYDNETIFRYCEEFQRDGQKFIRESFVALAKLEPYKEGTFVPHENTLSGPKKDRIEHLRKTGVQFGVIFVLYDDEHDEVQQLLRSVSTNEPVVSFRDQDYSVQHKQWAITDAEVIQQVALLMKEKKLFIADGHHRFETGLQYCQEMRQKNTESERGLYPYEYIMMAFVNMRDERLLVLPTHRLIRNISDLDMDQMLDKLRENFSIERHPLPENLPEQVVKEKLHESGKERPSFVMYYGAQEWLLLKYKQKSMSETKFSEKHTQLWRSLDVVILHQLILEDVFGIDDDALRKQSNIVYCREVSESLEIIQKGGAQIAFLMNPILPETVCEIALSGERMPQKSTDFFPKFMSGLLIHDMNM